MKNLHIDIETFSSVDITKSGLYRYVEAPDFEILLFGYCIDGGEVQVVDLLNGETIPADVLSALTDDNVIKHAYNAAFERVCLSRYLGLPQGEYLSPKAWQCTMATAAYFGLPLSLEGAGAVLGLEKQKLTEGKSLIKRFCTPPRQTPQLGITGVDTEWEQFKEYNKRDVETETLIHSRLSKHTMPESIWDEYALDQEINDRGVALDMAFVHNAIAADKLSRSELIKEMHNLTGLNNPNSVVQLKNWLEEQGREVDSLGKKDVAKLLDFALNEANDEYRVLELRQQLAKSSVKKYIAMENTVCTDGRARGLFQFYGASKTGRWCGKYLQPQNLPSTHMPDLAQARAIIRSGDFDTFKMLYDSVPDVLSQLIRTAFIPKSAHKFIVVDFSSIEAVVLAWVAREEWVLDAYRAKRDLYIENAEIMFNAPKGSVDKKSVLRQKSKIATLACGYGGSVGALKAFGALEMGIKEYELKVLVDAWRKANPNIVKLWQSVDRAAIAAVRGREGAIAETHGIRCSYENGTLFIRLPSSRCLTYIKPRIDVNRFNCECITYEGVGVAKKWERIETYGAKLVENIIQAISRDILSHALQTLGSYGVVMHIHDEVVIEALDNVSVDTVCELMTQAPKWAVGLPLRAEGFECLFYKKE